MENLEYYHSLQAVIKSNAKISSSAQLIPVTPWGKFTQSLNAAIQRGMELQMDKVIFQVHQLLCT
jgi:putative cell wall-binding protein